jgi:hypothetical protein
MYVVYGAMVNMKNGDPNSVSRQNRRRKHVSEKKAEKKTKNRWFAYFGQEISVSS